MSAERFIVEPDPRDARGWVATAVGGNHDGECAWSGTYAEVTAWVRKRKGRVVS